MSEDLELPHYAKKLLARLEAGRILCRTSADTDEALTKGGGHQRRSLRPGIHA